MSFCFINSNELSCGVEENQIVNGLSEETTPKNKDYYRTNKQKNMDTDNRKEITLWNQLQEVKHLTVFVFFFTFCKPQYMFC